MLMRPREDRHNVAFGNDRECEAGHVRQASEVRLTAQKTDQSSDVIPLAFRCFICFFGTIP
ncbi:hypothetical protein E3A20_22120, partial [Planctomyces bekefii]